MQTQLNFVDLLAVAGTGQGALMSLNIHPVSFVAAIASIRQMLFCFAPDQQRQCVDTPLRRLWLGRWQRAERAF